MGIWACIRTATGRERKSGWVIGMLGRRQATPRWVNNLVWQSKILGRRKGTLMWADEPVWWLWRGLGDWEVLGIIHKNKQQSIGFEQ